MSHQHCVPAHLQALFDFALCVYAVLKLNLIGCFAALQSAGQKVQTISQQMYQAEWIP
jgi:hypothetical protein